MSTSRGLGNMIAEHIHLTKNQAIAVMIALVFIDKLYAVLSFGPDFSLFPALFNAKFCPPNCWTFPTSLDYSIVWYWINLMFIFPDTWTGRFFYGVYIFALDLIFCVIFWKIKRIPKMYLFEFQLLSIFYYVGPGAEYQNMSLLFFYPLMFLANKLKNGKRVLSKARLAALAAIPVLVKLPLGWSYPWDFSNIHVQCVKYCGIFLPSTSLGQYFANILANFLILATLWFTTMAYVKREAK